jgi:hypothetical protein
VTLLADVYCWEPDPPTGMVSGGGGASLEMEGEGALVGKGRVKTCRHKSYIRKNQDGAKLTWGPGPSSGLGSGTPTAVAAAAAAAHAVVAVAAPAVAAVRPMVVVVAVAVDPKVVVAEGSRPSARPRPGGRPSWSHQLYYDASGGSPNQGADPRQKTHRRGAVGVTSLPPASQWHPERKSCSQAPCPCPRRWGPRGEL